MAKAKSKKITMEDALVPVAEQPYEVPENWCWTKIEAIAEFERGITFPASAKESEKTDDNIPCIRTANIQDELDIEDLLYVNKSYMKSNQNKLVRKDDVIMSSANSRELVGKVSYVHEVVEPMTFGGFVLGIRAKSINPLYLFYDLRYEFLCGNFMGESTQTTNIANINTTTLGNYKFPLPPLPEQQRIVEQIESLFSKLDEVKDKAQDVIDSYEERKRAILFKAYSGKLTEKWRGINKVEYQWDKEAFGNIILDGPKNGLYKPKSAYGNGTKILRIDCFYDGFLEPWEKLKRLELSEQEKEAYQLQIDDIVVNRVNSMPFLGKSALIRELPEECVFESNMMRIKVDYSRALPEYIIRYLNSTEGLLELRKNAKQAVNQASINQQDVKGVLIPLPSIAEQREVIRIINRLLEKESCIKENAEIVIEKIDVMKKSVLARAFRGELGTNNPMEESSMELLKQILK